MMNSLIGSWNTNLWKWIWFVFCKVRAQGEVWLSIPQETVLPQG